MKQNIQTELEAQQSAVFLWKAYNVAALILWLTIGYCGHVLVMLAAIAIQGLNWLAKWGPMRDALLNRQKVVLLKQQTDNLYVFSEHPKDDTVAATFEKTIQLLRQSGNEHGVKVHMAVFGDVKVFTKWWKVKANQDTNEKTITLESETTWREKGSSFESWEQYREWCAMFQLTDRDDRLRELRKGKEGTAWVHENVFGQNVSDN